MHTFRIIWAVAWWIYSTYSFWEDDDMPLWGAAICGALVSAVLTLLLLAITALLGLP